uniref:Uncharacterized protein n=1 Tax=Ixodes scapularis TaxID=6945 RepID=A0A4D5RCP3_IXOSC
MEARSRAARPWLLRLHCAVPGLHARQRAPGHGVDSPVDPQVEGIYAQHRQDPQRAAVSVASRRQVCRRGNQAAGVRARDPEHSLCLPGCRRPHPLCLHHQGTPDQPPLLPRVLRSNDGAGHGDHPDPGSGLRGGLPAGTQGPRGPPGGAAGTSGFVAAHVTVVHEVLRTSSGHGTKMRTVPPRRGRLPCPHPRGRARANPPDCRLTSSSVPIN